MRSIKFAAIAIIGYLIISAAAALPADQKRDRNHLHVDDPLYLQTQDRLLIYDEDLMRAEERARYRREHAQFKTDDDRDQHRGQQEQRMRTEGEPAQEMTSGTPQQRSDQPQGMATIIP